MRPATALTAALAVTAASLLGFPSGAAAELAPPEGLSFRIEPARARYKAAQALRVRFTVANQTRQALNVLKWHTPLEGFNADIFDVRRDGQRVPYLGRTVKRAAPRPEDYFTVAAGKEVGVTVDLGKAYAIEETGSYSAELRAVLLDFGTAPRKELAEKRALKPRLLRSNAITFRVAEKRVLPRRPLLAPPPPPGVPAPKAPAFRGCSTDRQAALVGALDGAKAAAGTAHGDLELAPEAQRPGAERYLAWFGAYQAPNYGTVLSGFAAIADALSNRAITFDCSCTESYYAYVYPAQPYEIYLCSAFWAAPERGTDSRLGTLVHETSHFYAVAGTRDHAYGKAGCQGLAGQDPARAIENADCYEYFAENDPPLSMPRPATPDAGPPASDAGPPGADAGSGPGADAGPQGPDGPRGCSTAPGAGGGLAAPILLAVAFRPARGRRAT